MTTRGDTCPTCGESHEIEGESVEVEGTHVYQECQCNKCLCLWRTVYRHERNIIHEVGGVFADDS